jgi:hypothetical protein
MQDGAKMVAGSMAIANCATAKTLAMNQAKPE